MAAAAASSSSSLPAPDALNVESSDLRAAPAENAAFAAAAATDSDVNKSRNSVLFNPALPFEEAVRRWFALQKKVTILPDGMYTNMARVLSEKDELDPMFKVWVTAGYLVREDGGRHNLHQREGVKPKRKSKVKQEDVHSLCSSDEDCDQRPAAAAAAASSRPVVVVAASLTANRIRRVPRMSEVVGFIHARHEEKLHPGSKATYAHLEGEFVGIPRILCEAFVARCGGCLLKAQKKLSVYAIKTIHTKGFGQRAQMDLFDMQRTPGGPEKTYRFVWHYVDHATKFSVLTAIKDKTMETIVSCIFDLWMLIGPPDLLQSDNGSEFKNAMVEALCLRYGVKHVFGRPYHPQTQGAVERANAFAKSKLVAWFKARESNPDIDWLPGLKEVQFAMNTAWRRTIKMSPYKLVFNRDPPTNTGRHLLVENSDEALELLDMLALSEDDNLDEEEERKEPAPAADLVDMTTAQAASSAAHAAVQQAAEATSAAYSKHMEDSHNTSQSVPIYKPGDLVIMKLRKKGLTVLQPKRKVMMVFRVHAGRGTANLYCGHGFLAGSVPFADLQPCPVDLRTSEFNWDWQELATRRAQHVSQGTIGSIQFTQDEMSRMDAGQTAQPTDPTSTQLMQQKEKKSKRALSSKTSAQLANKKTKVPAPAKAARSIKKPSTKKSVTSAGAKIINRRKFAKAAAASFDEAAASD